MKIGHTVCVFFLAGFLIAVQARLAFAREYNGFGPFPSRNQNPVYLQNLSLTPMRSTVLSEGVIEGRIDSSYSNLFEQGENELAKVDLDMEIWRLVPHISYGIADDWEIGIEIPMMHFSGGFLDGFIQKFHKIFGFPNAGRENVPDGRFSYSVDANGSNLINFPPADMGLGDISLNLKNQLTGEDSDWPAIAWFADLKFPTGRKSRGFGSGSVDYGFGLAVEESWRRLHGYFNAGYYVIGGNDKIENYMQNEMFVYMIAGELHILPNWSFIVQIDGSTPLLTKTRLDTWDGVPLDLVVGFRGEEQKLVANQDFIWQVGFAEDITSQGPSIDFTVFVSLGLRFDIFGRERPAGDFLAGKK